MWPAARVGLKRTTGAVAVLVCAVTALAQDPRDAPYPKPSTLPNPYRLVPDWPTLSKHAWPERT